MYCVKCGNQLNPTDRFCTNCGTPAAPQSSAGQRRGQAGDTESGYTAHRFSITGKQKEELVQRIAGFLRIENFRVQVIPMENDAVLIQAVKEGNWRRLLGIQTATSVIVEAGDAVTTVKIGAGKWLEKAVTGAVGLIWFPPLAITTGLGAYQQSQLPNKIFRVVKQFEGGY